MGVTTKLYFQGTQVGSTINDAQVAIRFSSGNNRFEYGAGNDPVDEVVSEADSSYTASTRLLVDIDDGMSWGFKGPNVQVSNTSLEAMLRFDVNGDHRVFYAFYPATTQVGYRASWTLTNSLEPPVPLKVVVRRV